VVAVSADFARSADFGQRALGSAEVAVSADFARSADFGPSAQH